jgi:hypothetical protein
MIREKRDEELGRQPLVADYGGCDSYREAVSYTDRHRPILTDNRHAGDFIRRIINPYSL